MAPRTRECELELRAGSWLEQEHYNCEGPDLPKLGLPQHQLDGVGDQVLGYQVDGALHRRLVRSFNSDGFCHAEAGKVGMQLLLTVLSASWLELEQPGALIASPN